jgi:hypothetical protein
MKALILILTTVISLSCSDDNNSQNTNIEFTEIAEGFLGADGAEGIPEQNIVIDNEADWKDLKTKMNTNVNTTESFSETEIDFSLYMIIASFSDIKNYGGLSLKVEKVINNPENIIVNIKQVVSSDKYVTFNINQPYYIAKIPRSDLPVIFELY